MAQDIPRDEWNIYRGGYRKDFPRSEGKECGINEDHELICQRDIISKEDYDSFGKTWIFGTYADAPKAWNNGSKMITDYDYN